MTRGANLALQAGVVVGTWTIDRDTLAVSWFTEGKSPPKVMIDLEADRLAGLLQRELDMTVIVS